MPFLAITPSLCINTLTQPFRPIYIRLAFMWIWCKAVKWVFGMTKQEDWSDKKRERKWLQGVKNNWDGIIAWIIYLPAALWLRASSRTSLEMDGRKLHLISFFENPYGVGPLCTLGVDGVDQKIVPSKTSHQDRNWGISLFLKRSLACSIAEVPVSLKLENCYYLKPLVVISSSSQIRGDNRV